MLTLTTIPHPQLQDCSLGTGQLDCIYDHLQHVAVTWLQFVTFSAIFSKQNSHWRFCCTTAVKIVKVSSTWFKTLITYMTKIPLEAFWRPMKAGSNFTSLWKASKGLQDWQLRGKSLVQPRAALDELHGSFNSRRKMFECKQYMIDLVEPWARWAIVAFSKAWARMGQILRWGRTAVFPW